MYFKTKSNMFLNVHVQYVEFRWLKIVGTVSASSTHPWVRGMPYLTILDTIPDHSQGSSYMCYLFFPPQAGFHGIVHVTSVTYQFNPLHTRVKIMCSMYLYYKCAKSKDFDQHIYMRHMRRLINAFASQLSS